jgi:hypothetical protein
MGLVSKGTLAARQQERVKEASGRIAGLSNTQQASIANGRAYTAEQRANKQAAIRHLIDNGRSHELTDKGAAIRYLATRSVRGQNDVQEFAKKDYRFAEHDSARVKKHMETFHVSEATAKKAVRQEQLEANWKDMNVKQKQNVDKADLTPEFIASRTGADIKAYRSAPLDVRTHVRKQAAASYSKLKADLNKAKTTGDESERRRIVNLMNEYSRIPKV